MLLPHFMDDVAHPLEGIGLDDECSRLGDEHWDMWWLGTLIHSIIHWTMDIAHMSLICNLERAWAPLMILHSLDCVEPWHDDVALVDDDKPLWGGHGALYLDFFTMMMANNPPLWWCDIHLSQPSMIRDDEASFDKETWLLDEALHLLGRNMTFGAYLPYFGDDITSTSPDTGIGDSTDTGIRGSDTDTLTPRNMTRLDTLYIILLIYIYN